MCNHKINNEKIPYVIRDNLYLHSRNSINNYVYEKRSKTDQNYLFDRGKKTETSRFSADLVFIFVYATFKMT